MVNKEEFENIVNAVREKLDDTSSALISEELLATISAFNNSVDEFEDLKLENEKLKEDKEELLKVNGKLYQKIGFDKTEEEKVEEEKDDEEEKITIEDVIDEKGEMI